MASAVDERVTMGYWRNDSDRRKRKCWARNKCKRHFSYQKSKWTAPGLKPGIRGERPAI